MSLSIVHLYQKEMNIYGDSGNREILEYRLRQRGIDYDVKFVNVGDNLPENVDILIGGGGQDTGQIVVEKDLKSKKDELTKLAQEGCVMLLVCGMYQLFGKEFITSTGQIIDGIDILPITTKAGDKRLIGNIVIDTEFGSLVGYENHSGLTYLNNDAKPLGKVVKGYGNNNEDKEEGCIFNNIFATYMHGPILSKNPELADEIIKRALIRKGEKSDLKKLDDSLELAAKEIAIKRPN